MMAEDKKILEAPKKVVDGLVEVFEGLAQMFSGVSDQLEKIPLLAADPEDEIPRPLAEVPALSEKKGAAAPHPRKKPVKKIRKADVPVEEPAEVPVADEPAVEDDVNSGVHLSSLPRRVILRKMIPQTVKLRTVTSRWTMPMRFRGTRIPDRKTQLRQKQSRKLDTPISTKRS